MGVGVPTALRPTATFGPAAGIAAGLGYLAGYAVLPPDLWLEPLGALVEAGAAIVLMLVGLALLDKR